MINLVLTIFILLANIVAILLVYYSFDKKIEKSKRLMYTMIAVGVMYILILIVYFFSSIGIGNKEVTKNAKSMITFTFVPVNTIIILPNLIRGYNKRKNNEISQEKLNRRTTLMIIVTVIVLVTEFFYFRNIQTGIINVYNEMQNAATNSANEQKNIENLNIIENTSNITNIVQNENH